MPDARYYANRIAQRNSSRLQQAAQNPENLRLAFNIRKNLVNLGDDESVLDQGKNILGRTFDVLSRPLYTVANVIDEQVENARKDAGTVESVKDIFTSAWKGISGKEKTTFSKVLDTAGVKNKAVKGVGGFALDVALDPLSYLGVGVVKKLAKEGVEAAAGEAASNVVKIGTRRGTELSKLSKLAGKEARQEAKLVEKINDKAKLNEIESNARKGFLEEEAIKAADLIRQTSATGRPGTVGLKYMGVPIGPQSTALYEAGSAVGRLAGSTRIGSTLNKAFRPTATFSGGTNDIKRTIEAAGMQEAERVGTIFTRGGVLDDFEVPAFKSLSKEQAGRVARALESGADLSREGLQHFVVAARKIFDRFHDIENGMAITPELPLREADDYIENYVPHFYDETTTDKFAAQNFERGRKSEIRKLTKLHRERLLNTTKKNVARALADKETVDSVVSSAVNEAKKQGIKNAKELEEVKQVSIRNYAQEIANRTHADYVTTNTKVTSQTLEKAKEAGLNPITDIREIMAREIHKHVQTTGRIKFANAIAHEFGTPLTESLAQRLGMRKARYKYLPDDVYFPKEIAKILDRMDEVFYKGDEATTQLLQLYDDVLGKIKFVQTVANPGHHMRNMMSDISFNFLDGVVSSKPYRTSFQILKKAQGADGVLSLGENIDDISAMRESLQGLSEIPVKVGKRDFTGEDIYNWFVEHGAKSGFYRSELVTKPGGIAEKIRHVGEVREDFIRLAHFIDAFQKEGKNLTKNSSIDSIHNAAQRAAQRVRKFNIDYGDLTPFERRTMKRVIPFYTFMRKNIPLQVENLFLRPGRQMVAPKFINNLGTALGQEEPGMFGLSTLPNYMRDAMSVRIMGEGEGRNGIYWNPQSLFPVMDLNEFFGHGTPKEMVERQLSGITPLAQIPIQQTTNYNFYTGRPHNKGLMQTLLETSPVGRYSYGVASGEQSPVSTRLTNWFTGLGLTSLNSGMQRGELRRQEDIIQRLLREQRERGIPL